MILELIYKRRGHVEGHVCEHLRQALCKVVTTMLPGAVCHYLLESCLNTLQAFQDFVRHVPGQPSTSFKKGQTRVLKGLIYGEGRFAGADYQSTRAFREGWEHLE